VRSISGRETADASIKRDLLRGVGQIRVTHDRKKLQTELLRTPASIRRDRQLDVTYGTLKRRVG
jgi:hypothetical protein